MDIEMKDIKAGQPLAKGDKVVIREGYCYLPGEGETPTHEVTVDCTTNAAGILKELNN
ncbi:MAG: hypothetical protein J6V72_08935 [Kiritimatiellae bacterium]|nr:hypothetical protein [Kiritimatiellia bacterium]